VGGTVGLWGESESLCFFSFSTAPHSLMAIAAMAWPCFERVQAIGEVS